jgi:hypothetical protein
VCRHTRCTLNDFLSVDDRLLRFYISFMAVLVEHGFRRPAQMGYQISQWDDRLDDLSHIDT